MRSRKPSRATLPTLQSEVAPSWEHPEHWFQTNTVALAKLVNHLRKQKYLKRYLHVSSPEAYGTCVGRVTEDAVLNPSTPYAASKAAADYLLKTYAKQFGFPLVTVRATNVYGARQQLFKIIPRSAIFVKLGRVIELHGGGRAVKSYIHIRDVSRGEKLILERGRVGPNPTTFRRMRGVEVRRESCGSCAIASGNAIRGCHAKRGRASGPGCRLRHRLDEGLLRGTRLASQRCSLGSRARGGRGVGERLLARDSAVRYSNTGTQRERTVR